MIAFADCSFRAMPWSHGTHNPMGYPQVLAERLRARGISLRGRAIYIARGEDLPATPEDVVRWYDLDGEPELVIVQTGVLAALRTVLGLRPSVQRVRDAIGRRLGRFTFPAYRMLWPLAEPFSHPVESPQDPESVVRFVRLVRSVWPRAHVVVMPPFRSERHSPFSPTICAALGRDLRAACEREGIPFVDPNPLVDRLDARSARSANGYNLSWPGHEAVVDALEPELQGLLEPS